MSISMNRREIYAQYILGGHWKQLRIRLYRIRGRKCEVCNSRQFIQGHHLTYRNPLESCTEDDVMLLCERCHCAVHNHKGLDLYLRGDSDNTLKRKLVVSSLTRFHGGDKQLLHKRNQVELAVRQQREEIDQRQPLRELPRPKRWKDYTPERFPQQ